jgi:hypothetical protein
MKVQGWMRRSEIFHKELRRTKTSVVLFMLSREVRARGREAWYDAPTANGTGLTNAQELAALRGDLKRIENGWTPSAADLADMVSLQEWGITRLASEPLWRLYGRVFGFPGVARGAKFVSTQVLAVDLSFGWARDRAAFYRLGTQDGPSLG